MYITYYTKRKFEGKDPKSIKSSTKPDPGYRKGK